MLLPRVITAIVLLAILVPILWLQSFTGFAVVSFIFLVAGLHECAVLCRAARRATFVLPLAAGALYLAMLTGHMSIAPFWLYLACILVWLLRLSPALRVGLPALDAAAGKLIGVVYGVTIFGAFVAMAQAFMLSPLLLLSVMAVVWLADIGAYFCGKAWGRRKLAPAISPGKSWEGAVGGCIIALICSTGAALAWPHLPLLQSVLVLRWNSAAMLLTMAVIVIASVIGDLFESAMKRRAGMKDSGRLLPGHGGILDRIDALIPVLPLAMLIYLKMGQV